MEQFIPDNLLRFQNIDQLFKDEDGQTVEFFLKQLEPSVQSVKKEFNFKQEKTKLEMTTVCLGNILVVESNFSQNITQLTRKRGFLQSSRQSRSMENNEQGKGKISLERILEQKDESSGDDSIQINVKSSFVSTLEQIEPP